MPMLDMEVIPGKNGTLMTLDILKQHLIAPPLVQTLLRY